MIFEHNGLASLAILHNATLWCFLSTVIFSRKHVHIHVLEAICQLFFAALDAARTLYYRALSPAPHLKLLLKKCNVTYVTNER